LLQQGYAGNDIRNALTTQGKPISNSDYDSLVQNAGMVSPTGRPMAGSDQFTQPIYKSQYQNYARPTTQFSTSLYGTQPMNSPALNSGMSRSDINNTISSFNKANPNTDASTTLEFMRNNGINREDFQAYGGLNNYGPQMSMPQTQTQQPFNPYTNSSQPYNRFYGGQQQSYQQQSYQPQQQQYNPFSYGGGQQQFVQPQMNNPFSYQPQQQFNQFRPGQSIEYPQQQQFNPYRQYETSLGSYNPYQQQQQYNQPQPLYQPPPPQYGQPQYGQPYQSQQDLPQYSQPDIPTSSGPSQAIYGRSSAMRGTPNVMRRAEGGITNLKVEK
jgi:hypothetical protein